MMHSIQEAILRWPPARWAISTLMLGRGALRLGRRSLYRGLLDLCWVVRVGQSAIVVGKARPVLDRHIGALKSGPVNALRESFKDGVAATEVAGVYSLAGGTHDLFRDLIVLKAARDGEKGVILLKYARTFDGVVALFDLERLMERYVFVLEPCWAGYCHPSTLMYVAPGNPVFVQCFTDEDYEFVVSVGAPLVALRLGPADWVNAELFRPKNASAAKTHDLVMVANWSPQKRHALLFNALRQVAGRDLRVLLIGFPWADRTADHVRAEAATIGNARVRVDILETVPQSELAGLVSACRAFVFLNRKEGDNKALVEAMFADVPAIVYDRTIGGARSRINAATGILTTDEALPRNIEYMLDHLGEFSPRAWALAHTGSENATRILDGALRASAAASAHPYTEGIVEKVNSPNLAYRNPADRQRFQGDYAFVLQCLRPRTGGRQ